MPVAKIEGIEIYYETHGSGPPLLLFAPGGFDATIAKWKLASAWKQTDALGLLSAEHTLIVYDRRESGKSGGRVEKLTWSTYAREAKGLLDQLNIDSAIVLGGCMGCSVALAFAADYPKATRALLLHWPVGGYRWKLTGRDRFKRHFNFARENGIKGIIEYCQEGITFWVEPKAGPWASVIARDKEFASNFYNQDLNRYLGIVSISSRNLFDRDTATGAPPELIVGIKAPSLIISGDDPSHAVSAAHYLQECLPNREFWKVMPPAQTTHLVCEKILEFCHNHR